MKVLSECLVLWLEIVGVYGVVVDMLVLCE